MSVRLKDRNRPPFLILVIRRAPTPDRSSCMITRCFLVLLGCCGLLSCASGPAGEPLFSRIGADVSGVTFNNQIQPFEGDSLNADTYDPL